MKDRKPENVTCPECDGRMVSRKSSYGVFWGCANYPKCTGTRDVQGRSKAERTHEKEVVDGYENW